MKKLSKDLWLKLLSVAKNISFIWEHVRSAESQALLHNLQFSKIPPDDLCAYGSLRSTNRKE